MERVLDKDKCSGCTACASICPKQAITMKVENDGFMYPVIKQEKCIDCGLCKRTCPILNTKSNKAINKCYVAYSKDEIYSNNSSSGGIFSIIADFILKEKSIVIGAAFDENNKLKHIAISKEEDLIKLKGSKYLQSDLNNIFKYVKENIKDKKILFVGTPCQVAGIKAFVKNNDNLICIDLACHGVPSPKLFDKYIKELESKNNDKLINYDFRDKSTGWDTYSNTMIFKNKNITELQKDNEYMKLFLSDIALRKSCFNCDFKLGNKYSDITLCDYWGVQKYYPDMYNKKGVSAIIINTQKGNEIIEKIKDKLICKECELEEILEGNPSIKKSCDEREERKEFFNEIDNLSINELSKKYVKSTPLYKRVLIKINRLLKNQ